MFRLTDWLKIFGVLFFFSYLLNSESKAEPLSEEALFYRCYAHLTQSRPTDTFSKNLLLEVKNSTKSAVDACMEVLDRAVLDAGTGLTTDTTGDVGKNVLRTFYDFHRGWFLTDTWNSMQLRGMDAFMGTSFDRSEGALFLTRALLNPGTKYSSIVTETASMRALRRDNASLVLSLPTDTATATGTLEGIARVAFGANSYTGVDLDDNVTLTEGSVLDAPRNFGGGLLGTQSYLTLNTGLNFATMKSDGGYRLFRRWSKAVFNDVMCRSLPVLSPAKASVYADEYIMRQNLRENYQASGQQCLVRELPIVLAEPPSGFDRRLPGEILSLFPAANLAGHAIPFRSSASCMTCHGTIDSMASVIRNFESNFLSLPVTGNQNALIFKHSKSNPDVLFSDPTVNPIRLNYSRAAPPENLDSGLAIQNKELDFYRNQTNFFVNGTAKKAQKTCTLEADTLVPDPMFHNEAVGPRTYRYQPVSYVAPPVGSNSQGILGYTASEPDGLLSFQSYSGANIEKEIIAQDVLATLEPGGPYNIQNAGIIGLGQALADTEDLYVCAASRYFQYFTGVQTSLNPGVELSAEDKALRDQVISFGLSLKNDPNQDLKKLIRNIISSEVYKESSFRSLVGEL